MSPLPVTFIIVVPK